MTGFSAKELVGQSCRILNCTGCKYTAATPGKSWCELFSVGKVKSKACVLTSKNGRPIHVLKSAVLMSGPDGAPVGIVETLTDISETLSQKEEILYLRKTLLMDEGFYGILGQSPPMQRLFDLIASVAKSQAPVLIRGKSGTGKELVARAIHETSPRKEGPFIKVNCAALNENLLESELFGHVKGAYTGADRDRIGRFEAAHGGTLFLDEIGDIPLPTQIKLLRVLEEMEIEKVGDHTPIPVNVRIISATNKDLEALIKDNFFREDFYFRINVFPIFCPPLSARKEDIPILAERFIKQFTARGEKRVVGITPESMAFLLAWSWPGNVRELRNVIEYALVLCSGEMIGKEHLPGYILLPAPLGAPPTFHEKSHADEREALAQALRKSGGNQSAAARILGVSRVTVWKRMKKWGLA
jgi:transcriptional regulator with PAS, ATPase and Fis domain